MISVGIFCSAALPRISRRHARRASNAQACDRLVLSVEKRDNDAPRTLYIFLIVNRVARFPDPFQFATENFFGGNGRFSRYETLSSE